MKWVAVPDQTLPSCWLCMSAAWLFSDRGLSLFLNLLLDVCDVLGMKTMNILLIQSSKRWAIVERMKK